MFRLAVCQFNSLTVILIGIAEIGKRTSDRINSTSPVSYLDTVKLTVLSATVILG